MKTSLTDRTWYSHKFSCWPTGAITGDSTQLLHKNSALLLTKCFAIRGPVTGPSSCFELKRNKIMAVVPWLGTKRKEGGKYWGCHLPNSVSRKDYGSCPLSKHKQRAAFFFLKIHTTYRRGSNFNQHTAQEGYETRHQVHLQKTPVLVREILSPSLSLSLSLSP